MAWEMVNYSCGHSERQQFYGPCDERRRKKEWMERGLCPECYRKAQMEKVMADETPVKIRVSLATANLSDNKAILLNAVAEGGTYREKENLKALGFSFGYAPMSGMFGLFDHPKKVWHKVIEVKTLDAIADALKFGEYPVVNGISDMDIAAMRDKLVAVDATNKAAAEAEKIKAAKKAEIGQSPLLAWIAEKFGNVYWNGKVYEGNAKYNRPSRVYLDNKEVNIPADVYAAQVEWRKLRDEINAKEAAK